MYVCNAAVREGPTSDLRSNLGTESISEVMRIGIVLVTYKEGIRLTK